MLYVLAAALVLSLNGVHGQMGCPAGWTINQVTQSCYFLHVHGKFSWPEAKTFCDGHNSHLAYVETAGENTFLKNMVKAARDTNKFTGGGNPNIWIGATDEIQEGQFVWYQIESPVTFKDWGPKEPNSNALNLIEDCLCLWSDYAWRWADLDCHSNEYFICEKSAEETAVIG